MSLLSLTYQAASCWRHISVVIAGHVSLHPHTSRYGARVITTHVINCTREERGGGGEGERERSYELQAHVW